MTDRTPPRPKQTRLLWRLQGPRKVAAAALYEHPAGTELRVYLEPEGADDVLRTEFHALDIGALEDRASELRALLIEKGWRELDTNTPPIH